MAQPQLMQIKLSRFDAQPWGFRLQGGVDFAAPLLVQKVNAGSLADNAGLQPGDAVIRINDVDVFNMRHKDAQDIVVRSGNNFVITVQRGGSTWRPHVQPTGNLPQPNSPYLQTVTKTSLAHKQQQSQHIGCGYNNSARPFANGGDGSVKSIVNKQYNTPVGIYSDESIAETLSAQAEVLAGGVLGVNFKKNEKEYQADKSEVLKFLREEETGQSTPAFNNHPYQEPQQQAQQYQHPQQQYQQQSATRHVSAPINTPKPASTGGLPTGQNICQECERLITGVFVRIKDKNLHVECFKCATCGTSLKNQGYYNFNNKLYCEIHAKLAALQNPPPGTEGYVPVPIKPNTKLSASTISSALNSHGYNNGVANGNSTPTPAPIESVNTHTELPLPPPPSPTQLLAYQSECELSVTQQQQQQQQHQQQQLLSHQKQHTRTNSNLSSLSSGSSSGVGGCGAGSIEVAFTHNNNKHSISTSSTMSLDRYATSPLHSRQTSASSASLVDMGVGSGGGSSLENFTPSMAFAMQTPSIPPPPPPPPAATGTVSATAAAIPLTKTLPIEAETILHIETKQKQQLQNENDMNMQNKNSSAYHKLLKEYSNKLLNQKQQQQSPTHTNDITDITATTIQTQHNNSNNNNYNNNINNVAKPYAVAVGSATFANQLKFNSNQVANPLAAVAAAATTAGTTVQLSAIDAEAITKVHQKINNNNNNSNMSSIVADEQSIYGQIDNSNNGSTAATTAQLGVDGGDHPFEYVTLTGNVIRSVVPPGKGVNINYKVNQGYARPYGAAPAAAAPRSPSYPPQTQQQQWGAPQQQQAQARPTSNPYATLPRSNVGQQGRYIQRFNNNINNNNTNYNSSKIGYNYSKTNPAVQNQQQQSQQKYRKSYPVGSNKYATIASNYNSTSPYNNVNSYNYNNSNNKHDNYNRYRDSCVEISNPNATNATLPRKPQAQTTLNTIYNSQTDLHAVSGAEDPTALLTQSIGKINMGEKTNNFMQEAGKIISNMLEARLANNVAASGFNSGSSLSLLSSSSANLTKSPKIVRKRLDLDDFKNIDPTTPVALQTVIAMQPESGCNVNLQVPSNETALTAEQLSQHPMSKILNICDNERDQNGSTPKAFEPVQFRNDNNNRRSAANGNVGKHSTHAADRRSYIESSTTQNNEKKDAPIFSLSVKALGGSKVDVNTPMSEENEKAVSQLLKDGKRPICYQCDKEITAGPFITALGRIWCPDHFICVNGNCRRPLQDIGFVEEKGDLYCEYCFEKYLAPTCSRCGGKIKGDCLNAIGKHFHPECFTCTQCGKIFGNTPFFLEDGNAYCEADWNELFTTKCFACGFPVEAGDRWVEALNHNYHSQCFNCTYCKQNLEGQSFYNKGGRPFCKNHAR